MPKITNFENCCRALILSGLGGNTNTAVYGGYETPESVEKYLTELTYPTRSVVAIINDTQRNNGVGKLLYKYGFRMKNKFWHENHRTYCYYYIKNPPDLNKEREEKAKNEPETTNSQVV